MHVATFTGVVGGCTLLCTLGSVALDSTYAGSAVAMCAGLLYTLCSSDITRPLIISFLFFSFPFPLSPLFSHSNLGKTRCRRLRWVEGTERQCHLVYA